MEKWGIYRQSDWSNWRGIWLTKKLEVIRRRFPTRPVLLDVGAGQGPYRSQIVGLDFDYKSHDFAAYNPADAKAGFREGSWHYQDIDYVSDIVDLPKDLSASVIICTDVLEHVPDPIRALESMAKRLTAGGFLIVIVPLNSVIHQAPYFFQPGLSPYWFQHHVSRVPGLEIREMEIVGDYFDFLDEENRRAFDFYSTGDPMLIKILSRFSRLFADTVLAGSLRALRRLSSPDKVTSSGKGICVVMGKVE